MVGLLPCLSLHELSGRSRGYASCVAVPSAHVVPCWLIPVITDLKPTQAFRVQRFVPLFCCEVTCDTVVVTNPGYVPRLASGPCANSRSFDLLASLRGDLRSHRVALLCCRSEVTRSRCMVSRRGAGHPKTLLSQQLSSPQNHAQKPHLGTVWGG